ncbi:MAG: ABC-F family ATP-binding cassette domain-containing protein [Candidatus Eisenbacteria bacterium]|uniref:ABC-F family ATP-binding cassette domain-containing protein n=1 Tax=Eiseniibacteriota bacterium TaxID=2212470 RepID=A0A948S098_UNCEI|nr:ABC-F family ATP-binding cassette domain-containing protein [Candidatus Eisenbacteria bacterium]MBU1948379.1 ABC-F family ATP-binding cassette domain-containing protein [Candidatus Eisenbacteria bacterium]MBU2692834.1 ABC-F family ATP-binding cassette domain-containing protein [Candidatus Eisenbacteria bacterium]
MSLITANNLAKSYGGALVFSGVSFQLPPHARIAIVGANGIGKTTLLRLLIGEEPPSDGAMQKARDLSIGYLPQEAGLYETHTLWEECLRAFGEIPRQEIRLRELEKKIAAMPDDETLVKEYGQLQSDFESAGGYSYETSISQTLSGLGFVKDDFEMPLPHLSGGQRTRALLARLLLSNPDLLILDEPTNHLDIGAVEWLEGRLRTWPGAVLIVSHDRYFLDKAVDHIWEMRRIGLETFRGNYSAYAMQRKQRWEERARHIESERESFAKDLDFIKRNIAGGNTLQAKGRLRRLSRMIRAIENHGFEGIRGKRWLEVGESTRTMSVEEVGRRLKTLSGIDVHGRAMKLNLKPRRRSGNIVLRAEKLRIGYPDRLLFSIDKLLLTRCECAALIGENGSGKTTFLRTMLDQLQPLSGKLTQGASLEIGYFAQAHEELNPTLTLIEEIQTVAPAMMPAEIRSHLGTFTFSGDEHFKKVSVLSGGERGRLALAKLALSNANFLVLDEPTNHLDIASQEILQEMLSGYEGTVLLVSHDRYLINALATQVWTIDTERQKLLVFEGNYNEYRAALESGRDADGAFAAAPSAAPAANIVAADPADGDRPDGPPLSKFEQKRIKKRIAQVEAEITELEGKLSRTTEQLSNPTGDMAAAQRLGEAYQRIRVKLNEALIEWETLQEGNR